MCHNLSFNSTIIKLDAYRYVLYLPNKVPKSQDICRIIGHVHLFCPLLCSFLPSVESHVDSISHWCIWSSICVSWHNRLSLLDMNTIQPQCFSFRSDYQYFHFNVYWRESGSRVTSTSVQGLFIVSGHLKKKLGWRGCRGGWREGRIDLQTNWFYLFQSSSRVIVYAYSSIPPLNEAPLVATFQDSPHLSCCVGLTSKISSNW